MGDIEHIDDVATLKELLRVYAGENARLHNRLQELVQEIAELTGKGSREQLQLELTRIQEQMGALQKRLFGDSSERRGHERVPADEERAKPKQKGHGHRSQPELERRSVLIELEPAEKVCGECQGHLMAIPGMTEDSERITVIRREFVIEEVNRQKYRCRCGFGLHTAPAPITHLPGGRYSLDFAIEVVLDKFIQHMPLDRQRRKMMREHLFVETQTLWDQTDALAKWLEPAYEALREYILGADVIGADETWWRLMQKKAKKKWWAWTITTYDACWFGIAPGRSAKTAAEYIGDYEGIVVCDAYRVYETLAKNRPTLRLANCWSHARRKFIDAEAHHPQCKAAIELIDELFEIERMTLDPERLDGEHKSLNADIRHRLRQQQGRTILDKLRKWALEQRGLPKSSLRKAIDYMLGHWAGLTRFLEDPKVPIHNNRSERALRGLVLGRKNHYGSRSRRGTEVAAIFYSLLDTAVINGLDPADYLRRAVTAAVDERRALLPLPDHS